VIKDIWSRGTTVLFATHQTRLVSELRRRTLRIQGGRLLKDEPVAPAAGGPPPGRG
jgi:ABC-type ATPase involved in cell division